MRVTITHTSYSCVQELMSGMEFYFIFPYAKPHVFTFPSITPVPVILIIYNNIFDKSRPSTTSPESKE